MNGVKQKGGLILKLITIIIIIRILAVFDNNFEFHIIFDKKVSG